MTAIVRFELDHPHDCRRADARLLQIDSRPQDVPDIGMSCYRRAGGRHRPDGGNSHRLGNASRSVGDHPTRLPDLRRDLGSRCCERRPRTQAAIGLADQSGRTVRGGIVTIARFPRLLRKQQREHEPHAPGRRAVRPHDVILTEDCDAEGYSPNPVNSNSNMRPDLTARLIEDLEVPAASAASRKLKAVMAARSRKIGPGKVAPAISAISQAKPPK